MNVCSRSRIFVSKFRHSVLALPQVRNFRENENFTFDWERVNQTLEKERKHYEEYNEMMGEAKFSGKFNIGNIEYTASQNPEEWVHVQNLIDMASPKLIPGKNINNGQVVS